MADVFRGEEAGESRGLSLHTAPPEGEQSCKDRVLDAYPTEVTMPRGHDQGRSGNLRGGTVLVAWQPKGEAGGRTDRGAMQGGRKGQETPEKQEFRKMYKSVIELGEATHGWGQALPLRLLRSIPSLLRQRVGYPLRGLVGTKGACWTGAVPPSFPFRCLAADGL